jgi:hypothetical protein
MEKNLKFQVGKVSSKAREGSFATSFEIVPDDSEEASRGILLATVVIAASEKFDAEAAARQVLEGLRENYYSQTSGGILLALEKAVTAAHQRLLTIVFSGGAENAVDFDLSAGVLWGSVFYLAQLGNGEAVIKRGGKLRQIGRNKGSVKDLTASDSPDVRTASGLLQEDDVVALGTPRFFEAIGYEELEKVLSHESVAEVARSLTGKLASDSTAAGIILAMGNDNPSALESGEVVKLSETNSRNEAIVSPKLADRQLDRFRTYSNKHLGQVLGMLEPAWDRVVERAEQLKIRHRKLEYGSLLTGKFEQAWDRLGRPRTALEGVDQARNRRTLLLLAGVLLFILLVGVLINNMLKGSGSNKMRFDNLVGTAQGYLDAAQLSQSSDKVHAEDLLGSALSNLKEARSMHIDDKKVGSLQGKVDTLLNALNGVVLVNPSVVLDLSNLRPGAQGVVMGGGGTTLYVLDEAGVLYQVDAVGKKVTTLSSDVALKHATSMAMAGNSIFVYIPTGIIYGYDLRAHKLGHAINGSSPWGKVMGLAGFGDYLYLLDSGKNMIWRYTVSGGNLVSVLTWLKSGTDLSSSSTLAVDGSVWVGEKGNVVKFVQGRAAAFSVSGANPTLGQVKLLYTSPQEKNLYLVDGSRLVVVDKNGQYVMQYQSDKIGQAVGLVVDEAGGKAYILAGGKVYGFVLK